MEDIKKAYNYSIRLLSKRDYSIYKLTMKLRSQKFEQDVIESTIEQLIEKNFIQEDLYAQAKTKALLQRGYSSDYIKKRLQQEHLYINDETIEIVQSDFKLSFEATIIELIEKKLRGKSIPEDYQDRQKLKNQVMRFLISKGHSFSSIEGPISQYF